MFLNSKFRSLLLLIGPVCLMGAVTVSVAAALLDPQSIHRTEPEPSFVNRAQKGDRLVPVRSEPKETRYV
jgi:hypothetical protein